MGRGPIVKIELDSENIETGTWCYSVSYFDGSWESKYTNKQTLVETYRRANLWMPPQVNSKVCNLKVNDCNLYLVLGPVIIVAAMVFLVLVYSSFFQSVGAAK